MLTFRFTGAGGQMTESELLTAGMTGKQVRFEFSSEWDGLQKNAVYRAGDICCIQEEIQELDTIPDRVLSKSLRRLYVGVYGVSADGTVVIPTVFVPGPFVHIGAAAEEDPGPDSPGWAEFRQALEETVRFTPQTLTEEQMAQARANIGVSGEGLSAVAVGLLLDILRKAVYTEEVSQRILELEKALNTGEIPETVYYSLSCALERVIAQPASASVAQGSSCTVTLTAEAGYVLESVTVTMGGTDITASAYSGGVVTIPAVTGNVVITAKAVEEEAEQGMVYIAASVYDVNSVFMINIIGGETTDRICLVTTEPVADTPFPVNGTTTLGDLYLLPVPETAGTLEVTSPGFVGGPQFFTLADGVYTRSLDAGWQTENGFTYAFTPGAHQYVAVNFKKMDGSWVSLADTDLSGFGIVFKEPEEAAATYSVTMSFTHVSAGNNQRTVEEGQSYINVLIPDDNYELSVVKVTMGGQDVTETVLDGRKINISQVTGALFITAVAREIDPVRYLAGSVYTNDGVHMINILNENSTGRICCVTTEATADTPFPVNGTSSLGDLYLLAVPETASVLKVTSPGFVGGPQFFNLSEGAYTQTIDAGWQTLDGFEYAITPGANPYAVVNFKKTDNSNFAMSDVDLSGFAVEFM